MRCNPVYLSMCPSRVTNRFDRVPVRSGPARSGPQRPDPVPAAAARRNRAGARPGQPTARSAAPLPGPQRLGAARRRRRRGAARGGGGGGGGAVADATPPRRRRRRRRGWGWGVMGEATAATAGRSAAPRPSLSSRPRRRRRCDGRRRRRRGGRVGEGGVGEGG